MLLTITTTRPPATDLGWLLHKHPAKVQAFELAFGRAQVFYPEASAQRCTAAMLLLREPNLASCGLRNQAKTDRALGQSRELMMNGNKRCTLIHRNERALCALHVAYGCAVCSEPMPAASAALSTRHREVALAFAPSAGSFIGTGTTTFGAGLRISRFENARAGTSSTCVIAEHPCAAASEAPLRRSFVPAGTVAVLARARPLAGAGTGTAR